LTVLRGIVVLALGVFTLTPGLLAAATRVVRLHCDGRAVGAIPAIGSRDRIAIEVVGCPVVPNETRTIQYRFLREPDDYLENPTLQPCPSPPTAASIGVTYSCPLIQFAILDPPEGTHFVSYSLLAQDQPKTGGNARKLGWLVLGRGRKVVTYALRARVDPARPFHLERLGDYPVITDDDLLYAIVVDSKEQFQFDLSFDVAGGSIQNPAPIRPAFGPDASRSIAPPPPMPGAPAPFADVLLAFGQRFRGGDVLKVSISTGMEVETKNSTKEASDGGPTKTSTERIRERQVVRLLDGAEYPPVHTRYAYNISTGLIVSWLRQPSYIKVQTVAGSVAADNRYRTETMKGGLGVKPVAALSFYLRKVDIQVPLTWKERAIPAPTLGFSLKNPTEDVFLGFSHELVRNTQVFYGWHFGKIDVRGPEGPLEDRFSTVTTVKRFKSRFFLGVTLNIGGIKDLITK